MDNNTLYKYLINEYWMMQVMQFILYLMILLLIGGTDKLHEAARSAKVPRKALSYLLRHQIVSGQ